MGPTARYAAEVTPRLLELSEDYTGIPYPYEKLDHLAIVQRGNFGAMENPGLITFAMPLMLARAQDDTPRFRQNYAHVAAHELAHMWFGDLVTHAWWDDIWLNESFATWMSDKIIERLAPGWNIRAKSVHDRDRAMKSDGQLSARRIRQPIESRNDIFNAFDPITYAKGGAGPLGPTERDAGVVQAYPDFVKADLHIITPNKRANVLPWEQYEALMELMRKRQKYFFDEANVGAGLPILSTLRDLIASGDVIVEANRTPVASPEDLVQVLTRAARDKRSVLLQIKRQDASMFVVIPG
jgi:hypothetical protein